MNANQIVTQADCNACKPSFYALQTLCALFDSATRPWIADTHFERQALDAQGRPVNPALLQTASFRRENSVIYAYWMPSDFDHPFPGARITATFWHGNKTPWQKPVLIDPLSQTIYQLPDLPNNTAESATFDLPLTDAPLLVTDGVMLEKEAKE